MVLLLGLVGAAVVATYASLYRPIWFDEYLQFAIAAMSPADAIDAVSRTTGAGVNHGQTAAYFTVDYILLKIAGANLVALRLPSILAATLLLVSAVLVIRGRGFSPFWQVATLIAFAGQTSLMYFAGEARPYMPLAAGSIAALAYYLAPVNTRRSPSVRLVGVLAVAVGSLFHPFYLALLAAIIFFAYATECWTTGGKFQLMPMLRFANPRLVLLGVALALLSGATTWIRGTPSFRFDPWQWIPRESFATVFVDAHFESIMHRSIAVGCFIVSVVLLLPVIFRAAGRRFWPPLTLLALALASSGAFSALAYWRSYWILGRQWVAGLALATLAVVWLLAETYKLAVASGRWAPRLTTGVATALVLIGCASQWVHQVGNSIEQRRSWEALGAELASGVTRSPLTTDDWIRLANANIVEGGPVWAEHGQYYERELFGWTP